MLVVWEPILATDWRAPSGSALGRIPDRRVRQFWDPQHLVSQELSRAMSRHPEQRAPACCEDQGFYWDDVIVYPAATRWTEQPPARFWDGPVWRVMNELGTALREQK